MTPEERGETLRRILDRHDQTLRALRTADAGYEAIVGALHETALTMAELTTVVTAMAVETRGGRAALEEAIDAALAANRAALRLHNDEPPAVDGGQ